jgi:hypothetical protein
MHASNNHATTTREARYFIVGVNGPRTQSIWAGNGDRRHCSARLDPAADERLPRSGDRWLSAVGGGQRGRAKRVLDDDADSVSITSRATGGQYR